MYISVAADIQIKWTLACGTSFVEFFALKNSIRFTSDFSHAFQYCTQFFLQIISLPFQHELNKYICLSLTKWSAWLVCILQKNVINYFIHTKIYICSKIKYHIHKYTKVNTIHNMHKRISQEIFSEHQTILVNSQYLNSSPRFIASILLSERITVGLAKWCQSRTPVQIQYSFNNLFDCHTIPSGFSSQPLAIAPNRMVLAFLGVLNKGGGRTLPDAQKAR